MWPEPIGGIAAPAGVWMTEAHCGVCTVLSDLRKKMG
jgi:hypothetical protein